MSNKITWSPSGEADIASYNVERAAVADGSYVLLANIVHDLLGPNYEAGPGKFFYVDATGTTSSWYRLIAIDDAGQHSAPSAPFQVPEAPPAASTVSVNHNYGGVDALRYTAPGGNPIESADIYAYLKSAYDIDHSVAPLARTLTDSNGRWVAPFVLNTGYTYTLIFHKVSLYGPDRVEIVV